MKTVELERFQYALHYILPRLRFYGPPGMESVEEPSPGDLVMLSSCDPNEWDLSFYVGRVGPDEHLLESLKTGRRCKWSNVGMSVFDRKWVSEFVRFRWSDAQFKFNRSFDYACRRADYHWTIPFIKSIDDETLVIGTRTRFHADQIQTESGKIPWVKLPKKELAAILADRVAAHDAIRRERQGLRGIITDNPV